jgi:CubicO group peptidase (beta-lactamase class C family)
MRAQTCVSRSFAISLLVLLAGSAFAASSTTTEEHIRRVQEGIVPRVLVTGEAPVMQSLAARMTDLNVPGVSIAVIREGRLEWARGFGVTSRGGAPVTANTLFQAASISKPVFSLAVLKLVDAGKLNLDANVNDYLKAWKLPDNEFTRQSKVTLRGILTHSAGLTVHGFPGYAAGAPLPTTVQILDGTPPANSAAIHVDIVPGTLARYSGGGYIVAQQLLLDVTSSLLPNLMRDSVLAPLGMTRSTYEQPLPRTRMSEIALPHRADGKPVEGGPHTYPEMAAAGLWTTPTDLARYALGVRTSLAGKSNGVISPKTARAMLTPVFGGQGLGPRTGGSTSRKYFDHDGGNEGYRCWLVAYEDGEGAIVMTNSDSGGELTGEILRTIAYVYQWPDFAPPTRTLATVKPELLDRYVGAYELNDGTPYVVRKEGDRLVGQAIGQTPTPLFASSDREFFGKDIDVTLSFAVESAGPATAVRLRLNGWERNGPRIEEAQARQLIGTSEGIAGRLKDQTPLPGSEPAIRALLAGLASGKPDFERMKPSFADFVRQQLPGLQQLMGNLGALKSLRFHRVAAEGDDQFDADFEKGAIRIGVVLGDDGRINGAQFLPR